MDNNFWDGRYAGSERLWSGDPHPQLVEIASDLTPGRALDLACGEGADALWLADNGWQVTAADFSQVAIERGRLAAAERDLDVDFRVVDLTTWVPDATYHLISEFYLHFEKEHRQSLHARLQPFLNDGGRVLVVGHHHDHAQTGSQGPPGDRLFGPDDIASEFSDLVPLKQARIETAANARHAVDTIYLGAKESG